jgi:hypothetical protein
VSIVEDQMGQGSVQSTCRTARRGGRLVCVSVPAGLWLRSRARSGSSQPDVTQVLPDPARPTLLIGVPGEPLPDPHAVAAVIGAMPPDLRRRQLVVVWGNQPATEHGLAQQVADRLGEPLRVQHGPRLLATDGSCQVTSVDAAGHPAWPPFVTHSRYLPGGSGTILERWRRPFDALAPLGNATYWLADGWVLELAPAGLLVRPATTERTPEPITRSLSGLKALPCHPDWVVLVVDAGDDGLLPAPLRSTLSRLADQLPCQVRTRLRVLHTDRVAPASVRSLLHAVPAPQREWSRYLPTPRRGDNPDPAPPPGSPVSPLTGSRVPPVTGSLVNGRLFTDWQPAEPATGRPRHPPQPTRERATSSATQPGGPIVRIRF